mmetsp:Transcript_8649/g.15663  ORF Transcript_8649/g.15663 Transcript_8649/m.15663 type:complete len:84 (+) Transcript_8649:652-903(+)
MMIQLETKGREISMKSVAALMTTQVMEVMIVARLLKVERLVEQDKAVLDDKQYLPLSLTVPIVLIRNNDEIWVYLKQKPITIK